MIKSINKNKSNLKKSFLFQYKISILFLSIWILDRFSKIVVEPQKDAVHLNFISLSPVFNYGLILNSFTNLPSEIKFLLFSLVGVCIFGIYLLILYIVDSRAHRCRLGLTCIFAGIMANFSDRFVYDGVLDFISVSALGYQSAFFNVADLFQWIGYAILGWGLYKESDFIRLITTRRGEAFVFPQFQRKICFIFLIISLCFNFLCGVFSFVFLKTSMTMMGLSSYSSPLISAYFLCLAAMCVVSTTLMLMLGVRFSNRIAGPVFSFQRYLKDLLKIENYPTHEFKLRDSDELKELENAAAELKKLRLKL